MKQKVERGGETRAVFPSALVATRRRRADGSLYLPPHPRVLVAPYPQKSHTAPRVAIFGDPVYLRAHHKYARRFHPFRKARDCQMECKSKKRGFCSCENLFINHSRKQNRAFAIAHLHLRVSAFAGKVKPRDFVICVLLIIARRGKLRRSAALPRAVGLSLISRKKVLSA